MTILQGSYLSILQIRKQTPRDGAKPLSGRTNVCIMSMWPTGHARPVSLTCQNHRDGVRQHVRCWRQRLPSGSVAQSQLIWSQDRGHWGAKGSNRNLQDTGGKGMGLGSYWLYRMGTKNYCESKTLIIETHTAALLQETAQPEM